MSKIAEAFRNGKAFIPFITCGDPDLETTAKTVRAMAEAGADLIELGIPFSDPTAEGAVIQAANVRALAAGVTTDRIFDMVRRLRGAVKVPIVFMTYANVVFSYGTERFVDACAQIGVDGLILPDVPYEEKEDFAPACRKRGLDLISLVAPTSESRVSMIAREASGFLYVVSSMGVTGVREHIDTDIGATIRLIRENTKLPCAVGFGISTQEQAGSIASLADGVIVGSAIVDLVARYGREAPAQVYEYVKAMKLAVSRQN